MTKVTKLLDLKNELMLRHEALLAREERMEVLIAAQSKESMYKRMYSNGHLGIQRKEGISKPL